MRCQILGSGSEGNSALIRAGDLHFLVDAGLPHRELRTRLEDARLPHRALEAILVTHGHLDHARSAGSTAKRQDAVVWCPEATMRNRSLAKATRMAALPIGSTGRLKGERGDIVEFEPVLLPHDCDPTLAFRLRHEGRTMVVLTDMGEPRDDVARALTGANLLVLEFNYDPRMLEEGPYPAKLKRRITGGRGHLSNEQAAIMLTRMAGPELHTLVLAHLSKTNNTPELALSSARTALDRLEMQHVEIVVASQDEIGAHLIV
ncbi:MAG: phosphoribosyl 1,2-cyclic phosphodiesterase [Planctomycetota bacterium]|jgi:phosphoribosyl 1,2-cyclic phosphodiesterase